MMRTMTTHRKLGRVAVMLMAVSLLILSAATAAAASAGEELRRIDTGDINDAHAAVKAAGGHDKEADDHGVPSDDHET